MSSINRFLSRRDKQPTGGTQRKVMSPPTSTPIPASDSSSCSSLSASTGTFAPLSSFYRHTSSSSLSSLSLAFPTQTPKRSPRLQATEGTIQASTANSSEDLLLQPKQTAGLLHGLFPDGERDVPEKDEEKKIKALTQRLAKAGITNFKEPDIAYSLNAAYAKGDPEKAFDLLMLLEESEEGIIKEYDPNVKLLGAVNREGVTCYLDALLFAMFARLGSFEAMLYNNFEDEPRKRLAALLRLWVNILRLGKLVTTDITKQLQLQLSTCGWKDAAKIHQQDSSEAFSFITETLKLPLLTLKMDIFHTGKEDAADDHKFVNERLLEVAIPEEPEDGHIITLEECLETYFNNRIEVKRYLERRNTLNSVRSCLSMDSTKGSALHVEVIECGESQPSTPMSALPQSTIMPSSPTPVKRRPRAPSIIQEHYVSEKNDILDSPSSPDIEGNQPGRRRAGTLRKEVMMPAWQFFSLIPWYTDNMPKNDSQVAAHFSSARPILGICLKRYSMLPNGKASRRNTHIDIPLKIGLPHFIQDDTISEDGPIYGNFQLSLQSVVCHRGISVDSGHYISLVRSQKPNARSSMSSTASSGASSDDQEQDTWMRLDDLAKERVAYVNIEEFFRKESPYLLFYQVTPIEGDPGNIAEGEKPPSYMESESRDFSTADLSLPSRDSGILTNGATDTSRFNLDRMPSDGPRGRSSWVSERRQSAVFSDASAGRVINTDNLPASATETGPNGPDSLTVSRHTSKITKTSSPSGNRRQSQTGNTRLSTSLSRLAGRLTKDRPDPPVPTTETIKEPVPNVADKVSTVSANTKGADKAKLKKEARDKSKNGLGSSHPDHHHHRHREHVTKGKSKPEKPERECEIM